jgi:HK97 family phage major capsid protein
MGYVGQNFSLVRNNQHPKRRSSMANPRLVALRSEFDKVRAGIEAIEKKATDDNRDLSDSEQADSDALYARAETLRPDIESLADKERSISAVADVLSRLEGSRPTPANHVRNETVDPVPTPGEYVTTYLRSFTDREAVDQVQEWNKTYKRVLDNTVLADNAGLVPAPILGDIVKFIDASRPVVNSLTKRPMYVGDGKRPRIVTHSEVAEQANEFDELASTKMSIVKDSLTRKTYGGAVNISKQDIEFTDPGMLQVLIEDMFDQYGISTDNAAADGLVAAATNTTILSPTESDSAVVIAALFEGANEVYTNSKRLPDTLWAAPDRWAWLGSLADGDGRQMFPSLNPMNAMGSLELTSFSGNPLGLRFVVDPNFASGVMVIGNSKFGEVYEQQAGLLRVEQPSTWSVQVAVGGYMSLYFRAEGFSEFVAV